MSRWLSNVNNLSNLLTQLDDQVETVVEERAFAQNEEEGDGAANSGIDDILAKRGLSLSAEPKEAKEESDVEPKVTEDVANEETNQEDDPPKDDKDETNPEESTPTEGIAAKPTKEDIESEKATQPADADASKDTVPVDEKAQETKEAEEVVPQNIGNNEEAIEPKPPEQPKIPEPPKIASTVSQSRAPPPPPPPRGPTQTPDRSKQEMQKLVTERKEAQKEARTLRRHIVSLNDQLEKAETELQAQRNELEQAGKNMEKDRLKLKKEKEAFLKKNTDEMTMLKTQQEKSLKDQQTRFEEQLERYRKKLSDEEERRKQQGGDWNKEMSDAIDREQGMKDTIQSLNDERAILLSQITTLQGQQDSLGSRLESLTQAADNAMQRERDAENRLDTELNQHARQMAQRQAREAELERTIQDLNAALVVSRRTSGTAESSEAPQRGNSLLEARIGALESDLGIANSNLAMEKERSETLQMQLRSFSSETSQEASISHAKEIQYDRKIADMSLTISKLEAEVRQYEKSSSNNTNAATDANGDQELQHRVKVLSDELFRLRDKVANHNSESLAMKSRLKSAVDRANNLEDELQLARASALSNGSGPNASSGGGMRRKNAAASSSIRSAMLLNAGGGEKTEKIGQVVDQIDSFAASTGKYLRRNPLARAGFIFYLFMIHLWTFVLLFFHAHSFDERMGNGADLGAHGPHAILQKQQLLRAMVNDTATTKAD